MTSKIDIRRPVLGAHARYRWDRRRGQHQIVFPEGVLVLNATAATVAGFLDGRTLEEVLEAVRDQADDPDVETDTREFLERLAAKGLLSDADDA